MPVTDDHPTPSPPTPEVLTPLVDPEASAPDVPEMPPAPPNPPTPDEPPPKCLGEANAP